MDARESDCSYVFVRSCISALRRNYVSSFSGSFQNHVMFLRESSPKDC